MTDTQLDLDALFARHKPAHVLGGGAEDYCAECMRLYPCDAVTALHALLDAKARAEKAEAALDGTSALAGEALERALVAEARLVAERDLAVAHDRQPYPTAWAYEQACKALRKAEAQVASVLALCDEWEAGPWSWLKDTAAPRVRAAMDGAS